MIESLAVLNLKETRGAIVNTVFTCVAGSLIHQFDCEAVTLDLRTFIVLFTVLLLEQ